MSFEAGMLPGRKVMGTGDTSFDWEFLDLPAAATNKLSDIVKIQWTVKDDTCYIDWPNTDETVLEIKADPGVAWELYITTPDHPGAAPAL